MVRTQIQLTTEQSAALRILSARQGLSMAEVIRTSIDALILRERGSGREGIIQRARSVAGKFSSGSRDGSANHDKYLADAFSQ